MLEKISITLVTFVVIIGTGKGSKIILNGLPYSVSFKNLSVNAINTTLNKPLQQLNCKTLIRMDKLTLYYNKTHYCSSCKLRDPLGSPLRQFMLCGCSAWRKWNSYTCVMPDNLSPDAISGQDNVNSRSYRKLIMISSVFGVVIICVLIGIIYQRRNQNQRKQQGKRIHFSEEPMTLSTVIEL